VNHQFALTLPLFDHSGPTRQETTISEARSYRDLALANSYFGLFSNRTVEDLAAISSSRILLEERALDSYYNIIFSLIEFWRRFAVWPERLTIVSHAFKRNRLVDGHCAAIGFPLDRVDFIGINPPGVDALKLDLAPPSSSSSSATKAATETGAAVDGLVSKEKANAMQGVQLAIGQWAEDPHGVGEELAGKRRQRNCWNVDQRFFLDDKERERSGVDTQLLEHGSETLVEGGRRPWANYN